MTSPSDTATGNTTFYNVPPGTGTTTPLIETDTIPGVSGAATSLISQLPKRNILIGLGVIVLIIAALIAYIIFRKKPAGSTPTSQPAAIENQQPENPAPAPATDSPSEQPPTTTTPEDWQKQYFGNTTCQNVDVCGNAADPDRDGLNNLEEYTNKTDPNNHDSDGDGLADGDEVHIFGGNPLQAHTAGNDKYTDADNALGAYNPMTNKKYTDDEMTQVKAAIKRYGLHSPTIATLGENALTNYDFVESGSASTQPAIKLPSSLDRSPQAMLDRDIARLGAMRKIGSALIKYKEAQRSFPQATNFMDMVSKIKGFLTVATNPVDPVNIDPLVYTYQVSQSGLDFTMTYYSESQNQLIKFTAPDAEKSASQETASLNDDQRIRDLETIKSALLIYSQAHLPVNASISYVFPTIDKYKTELSPTYLSSVPKDPKTAKDYDYQVSAQFDSFTLKAVLENPPSGNTGYLCNQEECRNY